MGYFSSVPLCADQRLDPECSVVFLGSSLADSMPQVKWRNSA